MWLAHYLTYLVEKGQQTVFQAAGPARRACVLPAVDAPFGAGHDQGAVRGGRAHRGGYATTVRRACCPSGINSPGKLAMMLVMVGYTFTGLYLLFGG